MNALLACGAICVLTSSAWAGGFTLTSFGTRRAGMLSNLGRPDEVTALNQNPAGLADQPGKQLLLFISPTLLSMDIEMQALDPGRFPTINAVGCGEPGAPACAWPIGDDGYYARKIRPERYFGVLPYVGASTDLGFIAQGARRVVVGIAAHAPNFYGAYFPEDAPSAYNFIGGMFMVAGATLGAGWRVNRFLSVGASVSYHYMHISMAQRLGPTNMLTPEGEQPGPLARAAQALLGDIRLDYQGSDHGVGWGAAVLLSPTHWLHIGMGYSGASHPEFSGGVSLTALDLQDQQRLVELARTLGYKLPRELRIEMAIPPSIVGGIAVVLGETLEIGVDLRLWLYNLYDRQTITPVYDHDDGGQPVITEEELSRDKDYHLSYQLTGGVLVRPFRELRQIELMAGAGYDRSPIPDETLTLDNPSLSQVKLAAGVRWQIDAHWRLSTTYLLVIYVARDIRNSRTHPPTNVRGHGFSHSPALTVTYRF